MVVLIKNLRRKCFAPYSLEDEDTARYTPAHRKFTDDSAWTYQTPEELDTGSYDGEVRLAGDGWVAPSVFTSQ